MSDEGGETTFVFKGNTKPAEASLDSFGDKVLDVGKKIGTALAAYASFEIIKKTLDKAIDAAIESDKAVKELNMSLAQTGQYTEAASQSFQNYASELQRATGTADETIMRGASTLVTVGKIHVDQLNEITKASLDLATAMHTDAATGFDIMAKAANGNTTALSKWGIKTDEARNDAEKFTMALQQIEHRFGGLAAANMDPFAKLHVSIDEAFESLGKLFTHSTKFQAVLLVVSRYIDSFARSLDGLRAGGNVVDRIVDGFFQLGQIFVKWIMRPIEVITNFFTTGLMSLITTAIGAMALVAKASDSMFGTNWGPRLSEMTEQWATATASMANDTANFTTSFSDATQAGLTKFQFDVDAAAKNVHESVVQNVEQTAEESMGAWDLFTKSFVRGFDPMKATMKSFSDTFRSSVAGGIQNALAGVGKALVQGGNAFQAFAAAALGALGQVAIQMGMMLIMAGLGWAVIPGFQASAGAVVFGAALVVLGGALQAIAGSMSSTSSSIPAAAGGTAGDIGGPGGFGGTATPQEQRERAQTGITVNVQGHVFDNRETGLQIAQIINDSFDLNGTIIRANA